MIKRMEKKLSEIKIGGSPNSDSYCTTAESKDDADRHEMMWSIKLDNLMKEFMKLSMDLSLGHAYKGKKMKKLYIGFSIPSIVIPIVITGLTSYIQEYSEITSISMIVVGITSGVNSFFNFAKKTEQHNQYENLYLELYNEIHSEMTKPKINRIACDVFCEKIKNKINFLRQSAPDL